MNMLNLGGSTNVSDEDKPCLEHPQNSKTLGQNSNSKRMSLQKPRFNSFYIILSTISAESAAGGRGGRQDLLQLRVRRDGAALAELVLLDVRPERLVLG